MIDESEYRIVCMDLPPGTRGCIVKKDDYCTILINARLSIDEQKKAAIHELTHLRLGHMYDLDTPVSEKENQIKQTPDGCGVAGVCANNLYK